MIMVTEALFNNITLWSSSTLLLMWHTFERRSEGIRLGSGLDILTLIRLDKFRCLGLFCIL